MNYIQALVNPSSNVDKLELLPKLTKTVASLPTDHPIYMDTFVSSNAPKELVKENIETLPQITKLFANNGKTLDVVDFVTKNVNLK